MLYGSWRGHNWAAVVTIKFRMSSRKAVCLLSGGLDSSTCLALARRDGYECYALSFDYGQRHRIELDSAARVAALFGAREHRTTRIDLRAFGASALTADIDVPKHRSAAEMERSILIERVRAGIARRDPA